MEKEKEEKEKAALPGECGRQAQGAGAAALPPACAYVLVRAVAPVNIAVVKYWGKLDDWPLSAPPPTLTTPLALGGGAGVRLRSHLHRGDGDALSAGLLLLDAGGRHDDDKDDDDDDEETAQALPQQSGPPPRARGLNLPLNASVSATLAIADLRTETSVVLSPHFDADTLALNGGAAQPIGAETRAGAVLRLVRARATRSASWKAHVSSENNFPTAAGLASSASGHACLALALARAYGVDGAHGAHGARALSAIARVGSGSASRSLYGGWVRWRAGGAAPDGSDSCAEQLAAEDHWPEMRVAIVVASVARKDVPSAEGMRRTVRTAAERMSARLGALPARLAAMRAAIAARDFPAFAALTMEDSDDLHACCAAASPALVYMNKTSHAVVAAVRRWNARAGRLAVAYTFDAGPNAVLFALEPDLAAFLDAEIAALDSAPQVLRTRLGPGPHIVHEEERSSTTTTSATEMMRA